LLVLGSHLLEKPEGGPRLVLVDLGEREADVDQHPVAGGGTGLADVQERDVDGAPHARDLDGGETVDLIHHLDDLSWNRQAHGYGLSSASILMNPTPTWPIGEGLARATCRPARPSAPRRGRASRRRVLPGSAMQPPPGKLISRSDQLVDADLPGGARGEERGDLVGGAVVLDRAAVRQRGGTRARAAGELA